MTGAKAKTVQLLLYDGSLSGVINIADSAWNPGEMYAAPRDSINELLNLTDGSRFGVYLLLDKDTVYIGQAQDLARRIKQHLAGKAWWTRVVLLTTIDDSLTRSDIDYLESCLIEKANKAKTLDVDNRNKGNLPKVNKFRKVDLDQYLEEALFLLELIGVSVFQKQSAARAKEKTVVIKQEVEPTETDIPVPVSADTEQTADKQNEYLPEVFYYQQNQNDPSKSVSAEMTIKNGAYIVKAGSVLAPTDNKGLIPVVRFQREKHRTPDRILESDVRFDSPSAAASFVSGSSNNGWIVWKDKDGHLLKEYRHLIQSEGSQQ